MKTAVAKKNVLQQFFHKLRVEPYNSFTANGLKWLPSASPEVPAANYCLKKLVGGGKLYYDFILAVKKD